MDEQQDQTKTDGGLSDLTDGLEDTPKEERAFFCSFCAKSSHEVDAMVQHGDVFICSNCIEICRDMIGAERQKRMSSNAALTGDGQKT